MGFDGTRAEMLGCFFVERAMVLCYNKNTILHFDRNSGEENIEII